MRRRLALLLVLAGCAKRAVVDHATETTSGVHKASAGGSMDASSTGTTSCATAGDTVGESTVGESTGASSTDAIDDPCGHSGRPRPTSPRPAVSPRCSSPKNSDVLDGYTRGRLSFTAPCFAERRWIFEAHASDAEGTREQAILLTDRRVQAVLELLAAHGAPPDNIQVIVKGSLEAKVASTEEDQRVVFFESGHL